MKKLVLIISSIVLATDVPQAPVAPTKKSVQSSFEERKARAAKKKEAKLQKYEARLEKGRKRQEAKGLTPKTQRQTTSTQPGAETPSGINTPTQPLTISQEIESIFNRYLQTDTDKTLPIDPESYDVAWDGNATSLESIIKQLENLEIEISGAVQRARTAKKSTKTPDLSLIEMGLLNIEAFADDSYEDVPYAGLKAPFKTRLMALSSNISSIKADLF